MKIGKLTFLSLLTGCLDLASLTVESANPPNIIVFIADDAGMDFGCYGNKLIKTPNIDQLANDGLVFQKAFLTSSQFSPTRTSILSGQFAHTIGSEDLHHPMNEGTKLLPYYLKQQGYFTGILMKGHLGNIGVSEGTRQFDHIGEGRDNQAPGLFNEFLDRANDRPFFAWVAFFDPHRPYGGEDGAKKVHDPDSVIVPPYLVNTKGTREDLALYYDEIHRVDTNIGTILLELDKRDLRKNTLIIFLSDNGMPFPRCKGSAYDYGIKTPLIIQWEGKATQNAHYSGLVSVIDLAPTILDVAGVEKPDEMYGHSIQATFNDQSAEGRKYIFAERNWHNTDAHIRCARSEKYKLIVNGYPELLYPIIGDYVGTGTWNDLLEAKAKHGLDKYQKQLFEYPRYKVELYDLENDPYEVDNLIDKKEYLPIATELNNKLLDWEDKTNDYSPHKKRRDDTIDRRSAFFYNLRDAFDYNVNGYWDEK